MFFPTLGLIATTDVISVDLHHTVQDALDKENNIINAHLCVCNSDGSLYGLVMNSDIECSNPS